MRVYLWDGTRYDLTHRQAGGMGGAGGGSGGGRGGGIEWSPYIAMTVRSRTMTVWLRSMTVRMRAARLPATCKVAPLRIKQSSHGCVGFGRERYLSKHRPAVTAVTSYWGRYHGGRPPSSDDSFHSKTVIPPLVPDKPSIVKRYHRQRTTRRGVTARSPTILTLHDTRFVECRWWNDG